MAVDNSQIIHEITPLSDRDCMYMVERYKKEFTYPIHCHSDYEFNFVENGAGVERVVGDSVEIIGNYDLVIIAGKDLEHAWRQYACRSNQVREITIQFSPDIFNGGLLQKSQFDSIRQMLDKAQLGLSFPMEAIMKIYAKLDNLISQQGFNAVMSFISILYDLSTFDNARILSTSSFVNMDQSTDSRRVKKIYEYINANYQQEIRLAQLSELVGMTPVAFSRFFVQRTGKNISDYIIDIKLGHVIRLLVNSTHSISEICYECGFNNLSNFNRIFKKKKNCSPKEFRENYRKRKSII